MPPLARIVRSNSSSDVRVLSVALAATLAAATGVVATTTWAVSDSLTRAGDVARQEEDTAYLVGAIAVDVSRIRAGLLQAVTQPDAAADERVGLERRRMASLDAARARLPASLGATETVVWRTIEPRVDGMLARFGRVMGALEVGDRARAESLLDESVEDARLLAEGMDRFREISQRETASAVAQIQTRAQRTLRMGLLVSFGAVVVLSVFWWLVLRLVAAQRRALGAKIEALEIANRDLEAFAGRVAHDMRNVLSPIQLGVVALGATSSDPDVSMIAQRVDRSCARGRDLVEGLLAFSRGGGRSTAPQRGDAAREIDDVLDQLSDAIRAVDVHVSTNLPRELPVAIGPALLHVVLLNVIGNAVKFMDGREDRRIGIEARSEHDRWRIEIADTGRGIPARDLPRVFDPLYRGSRANGASGVGLGLATVRRIVESRGGAVTIRSAPGRGTTVVLELPAVAPLETADRASSSAERRPRSLDRLSVEDA